MEETQKPKEFMVILWNDLPYDTEGKAPFKIEECATLKEAVVFMVRNGALFQHQEVVRKVNWLPGGEQPTIQQQPVHITAAPITVKDSEDIELANRPNPTSPAPEQPVQIGENKKVGEVTQVLSVSQRLGAMGALPPGLFDPNSDD